MKNYVVGIVSQRYIDTYLTNNLAHIDTAVGCNAVVISQYSLVRISPINNPTPKHLERISHRDKTLLKLLTFPAGGSQAACLSSSMLA